MAEGEQRRVTRAEVKTRCRGTIHTDDGEIAIVLHNISTAGAKLELNELSPLELGDELRLELVTPYGGCACEARLAWVGGAFIGVEFTELPIDKNDPLNRFVHAPGILHWLWRTFWDVEDQRDEPRAYLITFCPVTFSFDGADCTASMRNLSEGGAMLQIDTPIVFPPGTELDLNIKTPYGHSRCHVQVMWTDQTDNILLAGVQFIGLTGDQSEPLRALMDAPF